MSAPENGPAFPLDTGDAVYPGMSLRDYFAGQALAGLSGHMGVRSQDVERIATAAYARADAMLAVRKIGADY
ncbi:hypothetical protein [Sphingomonas immobilis]|uniref:Uncharacterized protein n=1 Tax=Sphingomonas immobilis TaxID=3063997 RepID=A0ABT8ZU66_9SPHN|nr:hypothetical protein [Sphingomonas sp. CA1-15]MDO7841110.1 hypothetical protein [Sphingomonas sp. CA1-15]